MKKDYYDALLQVSTFLDNVRGRLGQYAETAYIVLEAAEANAMQLIDSVISGIDDAIAADPVEDVVSKPKTDGYPDWLKGIFTTGKKSYSQETTDEDFWGVVADSVRDFADDVSDVDDDVADQADSSTADDEPVVEEPVGNNNLTREQKVARIARYMENWRDPEFVASQSDQNVDISYMGVLLGEKAFDSIKGLNVSKFFK